VHRAASARPRGEYEIEFSRIVAFSDGVFAIAITLLVLNLSIPEQIPGDEVTSALWDQRHDLFAYALSFAVIGRFWIVHHRLFGDITGFDGRLLALNLVYLSLIVLIPFSSQVLGDHGGDAGAVVIYAANIALVSAMGLVFISDARRAGLVKTKPGAYREGRHRGLLTASVFAASIPVALVAPHVAPLLWLALFLDPVQRRARGARRTG
jgi:uncharacterized membrane protein